MELSSAMSAPSRRLAIVICISICLASVIAIGFFYYGKTADSSMPRLPTPGEVSGLSAEIDGTMLGLPGANTFAVPSEFHAEVRNYFVEQPLHWAIESATAVEKSRLGVLHFELLNGSQLDLPFYSVGMGAIGFSIDSNYFTTATKNIDGGIALYLILARAREVAGRPVPK